MIPTTSTRAPHAAAGWQAHHAQASAAPQLPLGVRLRSGRAQDKPAILRGIWREKLNPLSVDPTRFTVAERAAAGGAAAAVVGFGQIKPLGGDALELASLVVEEAERGCGVGSALIHSLVEKSGGAPLYLTTIASRAALYRRCGFQEVQRDQVPAFLLAEYWLGRLVAWLVTRQPLVLMRMARGGSHRAAGAESEAAPQAAGDAG